MLSTKQHIEFVDNLIENYRKKRRGHITRRWLNFRQILGRVTGQKETFDQLRKIDLLFFSSANTEICNLLNSENFTLMDINEISLLLKNHRSAFNERDFYLIIYAAIIGILLLLPRNNFVSYIIAGIVILFSMLAIFERWNMKQYDAIYSELIEFLQHESKKRTCI